ncbi:MAG: sensor histidine kinase, partial [Bacillota bacterium]
LIGSFHVIDNGVKRLIRTIDLILNMSQLQTGYFEPNPQLLDIYREILQPVVAELNSAARFKNLELKLEIRTKDPFVECDLYSVSQIFINIIENAIKFTPDGSINIEVYRNENAKLCVKIKDTGIGISSEYMKELFTPFSQEEMGYTRRFEGNGLGLALVKKYCEMNNADIEVESEKGRGSSFTIIFN